MRQGMNIKCCVHHSMQRPRLHSPFGKKSGGGVTVRGGSGQGHEAVGSWILTKIVHKEMTKT